MSHLIKVSRREFFSFAASSMLAVPVHAGINSRQTVVATDNYKNLCVTFPCLDEIKGGVVGQVSGEVVAGKAKGLTAYTTVVYLGHGLVAMSAQAIRGCNDMQVVLPGVSHPMQLKDVKTHVGQDIALARIEIQKGNVLQSALLAEAPQYGAQMKTLVVSVSGDPKDDRLYVDGAIGQRVYELSKFSLRDSETGLDRIIVRKALTHCDIPVGTPGCIVFDEAGRLMGVANSITAAGTARKANGDVVHLPASVVFTPTNVILDYVLEVFPQEYMAFREIIRKNSPVPQLAPPPRDPVYSRVPNVINLTA